jgi:hypothetical protein
MQREKSNLFQIGVVVALFGVALQIAIRLAYLLGPLAHFAVVLGVILIIVGLVLPNRRF